MIIGDGVPGWYPRFMPSLAFESWGRTRYADALARQRDLVELRRRGEVGDTIVFTEHEPVITLGRWATPDHLLMSREALRERGVEVCETDRGGDITLHSPGQWVVYPILDLRARRLRVVDYIRLLEEVMIRAAGEFGVRAERREGLTGVWVGEAKLGSIGIRVTHWISMHGLAFNVLNDLSLFDSIVPCGIAACRMTSLLDLLHESVSMEGVEGALAGALDPLLHS